MSCERGVGLASLGGAAPGTDRGGTGEMPGFSRRESLFLGLAAVAIGLWGWLGVDLNSIHDPGPGAELPGGMTTSFAMDAQEGVPPAAARPAGGGPERGRQLFEESGCTSCHALSGSRSIGPSLRGVWGSTQPLADGSSVLFDRAYFEESVLHPEARIVRGYKPAMPSYEGLLNAEDLDALAEYIRSLK